MGHTPPRFHHPRPHNQAERDGPPDAGVGSDRDPRSRLVGSREPGGLVIGHVGAYDPVTRVVFGSFFRSVAADVAAAAPSGAKVLEVGCGPGHLAIRLVRDHELDVTGLDLDPAMIQRARRNAGRWSRGSRRRPTFVVGDVAALPAEDGSVDLVVSTFSMHHWTDPGAGLTEIKRVLRPGGKALIWDFKRGFRLFHMHAPDPAELARMGSLCIVRVRPWRWPFGFSLSVRLELAPT
jgi:SAM-dependent methyltransferase